MIFKSDATAHKLRSTARNNILVAITPSPSNINPNTIKVIVWIVSTMKARMNA
jgi:hypothetical protein